MLSDVRSLNEKMNIHMIRDCDKAKNDQIAAAALLFLL